MDVQQIRHAHDAEARAAERTRRRSFIWRTAALVVGTTFGVVRGLASVEGDAASGAVGYVMGYAVAFGLIAVVLASAIIAVARR